MEVTIVGVDCATEASKVGIAVGTWTPSGTAVSDVVLCGTRCAPDDSLVTRMARRGVPCLLAFDAPLGWPEPLARTLVGHAAGKDVASDANEMFRRTTDRFVAQQFGITPLDVGADRIARTAHAALRLLASVRRRTGLQVPLAWQTPPAAMETAIEVYPAATLSAHGLPSRRYKKADDVAARRQIIEGLAREMSFAGNFPLIESEPDALDAVVCLLAAKDFLDGKAIGPTDLALAQQEGWIWIAAPRVADRVSLQTSR
jgi:hypothetical protein